MQRSHGERIYSHSRTGNSVVVEYFEYLLSFREINRDTIEIYRDSRTRRNTHTVNAEEKSQCDVWIAAGVRTPFLRVDGPLLHRDSLTLSVPVARAMAEQVKGRIDFAVWGPVILNLAYNNLARELWLDAKLAREMGPGRLFFCWASLEIFDLAPFLLRTSLGL